jgi:hypothetical protein
MQEQFRENPNTSKQDFYSLRSLEGRVWLILKAQVSGWHRLLPGHGQVRRILLAKLN